jgi:hypothetical protein
MGPIEEPGRFPREPYGQTRLPSGDLARDPRDMQLHEFAKKRLGGLSQVSSDLIQMLR